MGRSSRLLDFVDTSLWVRLCYIYWNRRSKYDLVRCTSYLNGCQAFFCSNGSNFGIVKTNVKYHERGHRAFFFSRVTAAYFLENMDKNYCYCNFYVVWSNTPASVSILLCFTLDNFCFKIAPWILKFNTNDSENRL